MLLICVVVLYNSKSKREETLKAGDWKSSFAEVTLSPVCFDIESTLTIHMEKHFDEGWA